MPAAKKPAKPVTMMVVSSGGVRHVNEQGRQIRLSDVPVEVPTHVGEALMKRGKAVRA